MASKTVDVNRLPSQHGGVAPLVQTTPFGVPTKNPGILQPLPNTNLQNRIDRVVHGLFGARPISTFPHVPNGGSGFTKITAGGFHNPHDPQNPHQGTHGHFVGVGSAPSFTDRFYKAIVPGFLFKPAFGFPLNKDVPELRRLGKTPWAAMAKNTIIDEIAAMRWEIVASEVKGKVDVPEEILEKTKTWFLNPNRNEESLKNIIRMSLTDIIDLDAGLIVKVRNFKDEFVEMYARDGGTFTKNPDIFGILPLFNAYWQFGWTTGARPIPFNRNEIVYITNRPQPDSIYGLSPVEVLQDIINMLTFGVGSNVEYYTDNNIAKGVFQMIGADDES